jgi:hypothetical protein
MDKATAQLWDEERNEFPKKGTSFQVNKPAANSQVDQENDRP